MVTYEVDDLAERGARHAFALLLQHIRDGEEPFVTYGAIARLLEKRLNIPRVFPTHIGQVAGRMIADIRSIRENAPLINALVTRPSGMPGSGFGSFFDGHLRARGARRWKFLTRDRKLEVVQKIRAVVRRYSDWDLIYRELYGEDAPQEPERKRYSEKDGKPPDTQRPLGKGESEQHKNLKQWAAENPAALGLSNAMKGKPEFGLLSGDRVDVLFSDGENFVAVEVKSILSSVADWQRGLYQCVKYRAVIEAQERPVPLSVRTILLTEMELTAELSHRARELGVVTKVQAVNDRM